MNKYSQGKIYKLVDENDLWYIGSTTNTLKKRLRKHNKNDCMSRYLINPTIHLIEDYPCSNRRELEMREQYYLNKYRDKCINYQNAYTSEEEKKEQKKEQNKRYREKHKEKLNEKIECECGAIVSKKCLSKHRKRDIHKKKIIQNNINGQSTSTIPADRECEKSISIAI